MTLHAAIDIWTPEIKDLQCLKEAEFFQDKSIKCMGSLQQKKHLTQ